jgi:primosomal protein N' (replication factor Y) (superfamily II helicase)
MSPMARPDEAVTVLLLTGVKRPLAYRIPPHLAGKLAIGCLVRVPVGPRSEMAIVSALGHDPAFPYERLKLVFSLEQPFPVLDPTLIQLAQWMAGYYACGLDAVLECMLPAALRNGTRSKEHRMLTLGQKLDDNAVAQLAKRAPQQAKLYVFLASQLHDQPVERRIVLERLAISDAVANALVDKGLLVETAARVQRTAYEDESSDLEQVAALQHALNDEQQAAVTALRASLATGGFHTHLLHGVTGSGKTEVYLRLLQDVVDAGDGALFLVPEVALTPQTVGRLRARLEQCTGCEAVIWHSHLSDGERHDAWYALATGRARVVVGARSAVFAPVQRLRLIIVDEEHEPAYKQDETPRYHGRDVAVFRAFLDKAVCILGSATPSLESYANARNGKYQLNVMAKRVDDRPLPIVYVIDMRREFQRAGGAALFSRLLADKMRDRFEKGEQTILFLNRRGYDTSLSCPDCGYVAVCDHCDITLTHHRTTRTLRCHMCGHTDYVPHVCPQCRSTRILYRGSGTQKVEEFAQRILPLARIVRMDADTMHKRHLFRETLADFRRGRIHVMVGTQMIAKGLDFPNVTLVGLLDADISLHLPDFRAAERTFQLMVQVAGRAGRGDLAGEVVVQTGLPHAGSIQFARRQDYEGFFAEEIEQRQEQGYPPFRHLVHHLLRSRNPEKLQFYSEQWARHLKASLTAADACEIRGPVDCPVARIQDFHRRQLWYLVPSAARFVPVLQKLRSAFRWDPEIIEVVDTDAVSLM